MKSFFPLFLALVIAVPLSFADASKGSGSEGSLGIQIKSETGVKVESSDDDGTPDQGRGDFTATGERFDESSDDDSMDASNSPDDDGTPDQGRGDVDVHGVLFDESGDDESGESSTDDDGTPDQGSGDFFFDLSSFFGIGNDDDGSNTGGDEGAEASGEKDIENETSLSESEQSVMVRFFVSLFSWFF